MIESSKTNRCVHNNSNPFTSQMCGDKSLCITDGNLIAGKHKVQLYKINHVHFDPH